MRRHPRRGPEVARSLRILEGPAPAGEFAGKVAIVTGAARGIGRGIAIHLAGLGAAVVVADQNGAGGRAVGREIERGGGKACMVEMHLERPKDAARTVQSALEEFGRLDVLVNNAATLGRLRPLTELTVRQWERVIKANLTGTFLLSQAAARVMKARKAGGAIINILAIQAHCPVPWYGAYVASKGGLEALTRALAVELTGDGIRVNAIEAGSVYTESVNAALPRGWIRYSADQPAPAELDRLAPTLVGRMGRPSDIAKVVAFLASDRAAYLAGAIIRADGGRLLSRKPDPLTRVRRAAR